MQLVQLTGSADELARSQAEAAKLDPAIYCSLVLELALRERAALDQSFADALAKVSARNG